MQNKPQRTNNLYRPSQYNNTAVAYDYDEFREQVNKNRAKVVEREKLRKRNIRNNRAVLLRQKEDVKKDRINHILCYILAIQVLCSSVFILYQFDQNNIVKSGISEKQAIINEQEKEISAKKIALAESINVYEIEDIARNELNMKTPSQDQIIYITLPKNRSYIEY